MTAMTADTRPAPPLTAVQAVAAVMADLEAIPKTNQGHGYRYRGIDDVVAALSPLLARHGVVIVPTVVEVVTVPAPGRKEGWTATRAVHRFEVFGPDGSSFTGSAAGDGLSNQGTGPGIAASYASKTFLLQLFCIPTEATEEAEQVPPVEYVSEKQAGDIAALFSQIVDAGTRLSVKRGWAGEWGNPTSLPLAKFDAAYKAAMEAVEAASAAEVSV